MMQEQVDRLIADFVAAAKKHHESTMQANWRETNKQAKRISKAFRGITEIGESARQKLLDLVDSADLAVASMAAAYSLKYNTERSKAALERIAREPGMIGFGAEQALRRWKEGEWQLE